MSSDAGVDVAMLVATCVTDKHPSGFVSGLSGTWAGLTVVSGSCSHVLLRGSLSSVYLFVVLKSNSFIFNSSLHFA